jgi:uncharacterized protein YbaR (Trm112 family)
MDQSQAFCTGCGHTYQILDGIPVLIAERAEPSASTK